MPASAVIASFLWAAVSPPSSFPQETAAADQPSELTLSIKGSSPNLEAGSILLRLPDGDPTTAGIVRNPSGGQSLRPQINYEVSGLTGPTAHRIRISVNQQVICDGDVTTDNGIRIATCGAFQVPSGRFSVVAELDVNSVIRESSEEDNVTGREYDTNRNVPMDMVARSIDLITPDGQVVTQPQVGDQLFLAFSFDIEQEVNYFWRAELRVNGARLCGRAFYFPNTVGQWTTVCNQPIEVPAGVLTISGVADYLFEQSETSESNNSVTRTIETGSGSPTVPNIRVDRLDRPFFCCTPPPPATRLGAVISSDGSVTAVGEPFFEEGRLLVYGLLDGMPVFDDLVLTPQGFRVDNFGSAVAVSGTTMIVGAPLFEPVNTADEATKGLARLKGALYEQIAGNWEFLGAIDPGTAQEDDQFGFAIAIEGDMVVIGAPSDAEGEPVGQGSGAVYLFERQGDNLVQRAKVKPANPQPGQGFGAAVAMKRDKIAVGSPFSRVGGAVTGSATLLEMIGNNLGTIDTVTGSDAGNNDGFGTAVAISGETLVVGAPNHDGAATNDGMVYLFDVEGDSLVERDRLSAPDPVSGAAFGSAVSTEGVQILVGAPGAPGDSGNNGAIYSFAGPTIQFKIPGPAATDDDFALEGFGASIDLAGDRLAVGAPMTDDEQGGAALVAGLPPPFYDGPWFNMDQSGHGWFVEHLGPATPGGPDRINAYWYVYLNQLAVWLTGQGSLNGSQATLDMFITEGADFPPDFDSDDVNLIPWGTLSFDFGGGTTGLASWQSNVAGFGSGSLSMVRIIGISELPEGCRSGSYFNTQQGGHGFVAEVVTIDGQPQILIAWYVYLNGEQVWLLGQAPLVNDRAVITLGRFTGADFPPAFDPDDVVGTAWGTLTFTFTGPDSARAVWDSNTAGFADGSLDLVRLTTLKDRACD